MTQSTTEYVHKYNLQRRRDRYQLNRLRKLKANSLRLPKACEICKKRPPVCGDHDHTTGKFRGFLCGQCNSVLGMAQDDTNVLLDAAKFLMNQSA